MIAVGTGGSTPFTTVYVDDRDFADIDDDGNAGGLWIYMETNGVAGLQRGGYGLVARPEWPAPDIPPTQVLPPNPGGLPVLPYGFWLPDDIHVKNAYYFMTEFLAPSRACVGPGQEWDGEPDQLLV